MSKWRSNFQDTIEIDDVNKGLVVNGKALTVQGELTEYGLTYFVTQLRFAEEAIAKLAEEIEILKWYLMPEANESPEEMELLRMMIAKSEKESASLVEYRDFVQGYLTGKDLAAGVIYEG